MKVLLISHTCQSRVEGQPKAQCLGNLPDVELLLLMPDRWRHYGRWRAAEIPRQASYQYRIGRVAWPWIGPAQNYLHWYPQLGRILHEFQPDVIDLWEEPWALVSAHACWLRHRLVPHAKIVAETEQNIEKVLPPPFESLRSYILRKADYAVARNSEAVQVLRAKGYDGPAEVVPNAVDAELFRPLDREVCRHKLGLVGFVAGYVGRLVEEKGLMDMIDALAFCPPDVNLLFVGDGAFQPQLEQQARAMGKANQVRFLPGRPQAELPEVMNAINVLVLPSRTTPRWKEQFGRVIIEANACGTPVIGSSSGAIPDVIGAAGLVVPERDPAALAGALVELKSDPERSHQMGLEGRRQAEEYYTWKRVAQRMRNIYLKALS
ncbi:MAG TPA: glycosyltransferase [Abditibacteriaceae bacterium]|nr:glycosyltransferase [Abditibacteriaceae bacterium]